MITASVSLRFIEDNVVNAIALGGLYALYALGLAIVFSVMKLVNFAYGQFVMAGAYVVVLLDHSSAAVILICAIPTVVLLALVSERVAFRPLRDANPATLFITSFAVSYLLQNGAILIFGSLARTTAFGSNLSTAYDVHGVAVQKLSLVIIAVVAISLATLAMFLRSTRLGLQMRAAAFDFRMARLLGVRANVVIATAFAISGALAAVASVLLVAQTGSVSPLMGANVILYAFIANIVGGMGSLPGAVTGGLLVGCLSVAFEASLPPALRPYRDAFIFAAVIVLLVVRPGGLFSGEGKLRNV